MFNGLVAAAINKGALMIIEPMMTDRGRMMVATKPPDIWPKTNPCEVVSS
jgi:hypothetical protein